MRTKYKTKPTPQGWWVEYTYNPEKSQEGKPVFVEEAVFPDGHRERFRVFGGIIFGFTDTRLGLQGHEPPEDILEVIGELPEGALVLGG